MKKAKLFVLLAVSAAMFAMPAVASAGTPLMDPGGTTFTGTFGNSTLGAQGEPTITCEGPNHVHGLFNTAGAGGAANGGTISLDYTNCHVVVFFVTIPCHTAGAPETDTIAINNQAFDLTYAADNKTSPAVLVTNVNVEIECGETTPIKVTGNVIGTITSPKCGGTSNSATISFGATNNVQNHRQVTGTGALTDLTAQTTGGNAVTAGLNTTATINKAEGEEGTLTCV